MQTYFEWHGVHTWSRICSAIDFQTLVTHNHTIICGSLAEGLTYSPCANHAQAYCHKKDCGQVGFATETMPTHSFTFLFTMSVQLFSWWFQFSYPLIYRQKRFCKSCDRFTYISSLKSRISTKSRKVIISTHSFVHYYSPVIGSVRRLWVTPLINASRSVAKACNTSSDGAMEGMVGSRGAESLMCALVNCRR